MHQIKNSIFLIFFLFSASSFAQEVFIIEGDTLNLKREVNGNLRLYYNQSIDSTMRFFLQKGSRMSELKEESLDGIPQFRIQLDTFTEDSPVSTRGVPFSLSGLKDFVITYNSRVEDRGSDDEETEGIQMRIGFFTGLSNKVYVDNPDNILVPIVGLGFEIFDPKFAPRHSGLLHLRHSFEQDDFSYSATELSVNYRFRLFDFSNVSIHIDTELATLLYFQEEVAIVDQEGQLRDIRKDDGFSLETPFSFGVGSDIKVTDNSFITLGYNDVVTIFLDSNGNFPIDFTIGYKYRL